MSQADIFHEFAVARAVTLEARRSAEEGSQMDIAPGAVSRKIDDMSCIVIDLDVLPPEVAVEPTSPHSTCLLT